MTAPAARNRATTGASRSGIRSTPPAAEASGAHPIVDGRPAKSIASLTTTGTPANGPKASPAARRASIARASASTLGFIDVKAL